MRGRKYVNKYIFVFVNETLARCTRVYIRHFRFVRKKIKNNKSKRISRGRWNRRNTYRARVQYMLYNIITRRRQTVPRTFARGAEKKTAGHVRNICSFERPSSPVYACRFREGDGDTNSNCDECSISRLRVHIIWLPTGKRVIYIIRARITCHGVRKLRRRGHYLYIWRVIYIYIYISIFLLYIKYITNAKNHVDVVDF